MSRRALLQGTAATGLLLGFRLRLEAAEDVSFAPNVYLRIDPDETVTVFVVRQEMGQGVRTLLPMMIAEELEADWSRVRLEQAMPGGRFKDVRLHTSGSGSTSGTYRNMRLAGATAREMLVAAAAREWGVDPSTCRARLGAVTHAATGRRKTYGQLAAAASALPVPTQPALKDPKDFTLLGQPTRRVDGPAIVTGTATYGIDVKVPGMLHATIERAPTLGAKLVSFDAAKAKAVPGVLHVVPVTAGVHAGVAVVARDTWSALRGRQALDIRWAPGPHADFDSARYMAGFADALEKAPFKVRHEGDARAALAASARQHDASYAYPFQAHAALEPMNCTADVRADGAELWIPTQTAIRSMAQVVRVTGLPEDKIRLHCTLMGGGFGRRLFADFVAEAAEISKVVGKPVQVLWTRADDLRHGYFQPATAERFTGGVDAAGNLTGLVHRTSNGGLSIYEQHEGRSLWPDAPPEPPAPDSFEKDEIPWGAFDNPYAIANLRVDCASVPSPVPTGPWRAVMYPSTVFGRESFLDELAHLASRDPLEFRKSLLPTGRLAHVLEEVARKAGWSTPLNTKDGRKRGRGVAANVYHRNSFIAMVAEVSTAPDLSDLRVERIVTVVDCGLVLNPLGLEGQAESGITWGLSAALLPAIEFRKGAAVAGSYAEYDVLRIDRMPRVELHVVPSTAEPAGFGEHAVPPVAPAVANALFAATGKRLRTLPFTAEALGRA